MTKTISLNHLTKIEGHATLALQIDGMQIKKCELSSVEGSRYFEGILKGHYYYEASEISSRICGICSCAHTVAAIIAIERALDVTPSPQTVALRKLLTIGERIRSHATHLYFLALPDYLGYESALSMLPKYKKEIEQAIKLIKAGNVMIRIIGGRDLHPVSNTIGGMLKLPTEQQLRELENVLKGIQDIAIQTVSLFSQLKNKPFERKVHYLSLATPKEYAMLEGFLKSERGIFKPKDFHMHIAEIHKEYSTANFVFKDDKPYRVGALARINNNHSHLSKTTKKLMKNSSLKLPNYNPFYNNLAQALELVHCVEQSLSILQELPLEQEKVAHFKDIPVREGHG